MTGSAARAAKATAGRTVPAGAGSGRAPNHAENRLLLRRQDEMLGLLASGASLSEVLTRVVTALEELMDGARCSVLLLDPVTGTLRHGAAPSLPDSYARAIDGMRVGPSAGSCGTAAYLGRPVIAEDITVDRRWDAFRALAVPHQLRSCWSTPIHGREGITGTFAVYHDRPHRPSAREERLVGRVTHLASVAIDHANLFGALAESEERFRHAFEDSAAGMALTDLAGRFVKVNAALAEMLMIPESDLLAVACTDVLTSMRAADGGDPAALFAEVAAARRESAQFDARARRADGAAVSVTVVASAVRGAGGAPVHLCLNILDVTQREVAEAERRARCEAEVAREVAERASQAKSEFLTALSHELRTPLQAISGFAELLGTLDLPGDRRQAAISHILDATVHVISLADDVLDIARIEAGALTVCPGRVPVAGVIGDVLDLLGPLANKRGITVTSRSGAAVVRADGRRLRQVLINLVTNAIRYNRPEGSVSVTADLAGDEVGIRVTDTGRGIHPELLGRLFVSFDRLGEETGAEQGVGLGLPLARGLTEAMGGTLSVRSEPGAGTTVTVALPCWRGAG